MRTARSSSPPLWTLQPRAHTHRLSTLWARPFVCYAELHDINEFRIHTLEGLLNEKERELTEGKQRISKLKEDFKYNLKLLEERDAELERYDASFSHLKAIIRDRDIEVSELKISTAEMQHSVKQERDRATESDAYFQQKLAQTREHGEATRWKLDEELRAQRDEFEAYKCVPCRITSLPWLCICA